MLKRLYDRVLSLAGSRSAPAWLVAVAFAESSVFPLPPDALLAPMVLARPARAWRYATLCTLGSVAGGALGYWIGLALFDAVAVPVLRTYGLDGALIAFRDAYARWGVWVILLKGLTPIPYKLVAIASGAAHFGLPVFLLASLATRGARFFLLAWALRRYGPAAGRFLRRRSLAVTASR